MQNPRRNMYLYIYPLECYFASLSYYVCVGEPELRSMFGEYGCGVPAAQRVPGVVSRGPG